MTYQYTDLLIFEKKKIFLNDELLEDYFKDFPERKPQIEVHETALWRGYVATFEVKEDQLFIRDIEVLTNTDMLLDPYYMTFFQTTGSLTGTRDLFE